MKRRSTPRSFRTQVRSMMVKHHVPHEPNTFHQQSHNASSICNRSATSRSAAGAATVSEARHVRTRIRPGLIQETTQGWAWATSSLVVSRVMHGQNSWSMCSTFCQVLSWPPTPPIDPMRMPQVRGVYIMLDRHIKHGGTKGVQHDLDGPKCSTEQLLALEDLAAAKPEEPAAGKAQASSSSSVPAGVPDVGSTALDVPWMRAAPLHWCAMARSAPWRGQAAVQL